MRGRVCFCSRVREAEPGAGSVKLLVAASSLLGAVQEEREQPLGTNTTRYTPPPPAGNEATKNEPASQWQS